MFRQILPVAVLFGAAIASTPSSAAISLSLKYTTTNESNIGTQTHHGLLQFVLADQDVKVYDLADGQNTLIATRSSGKGFLFGPVQFGVSLDTNTVDLYGEYSSHTLHTHVTTDGETSCKAEITNTLKPGHTVYDYVYPKVGPVQVTKATISDVSCEFAHIDETAKPGVDKAEATEEAKPVADKPVADKPVASRHLRTAAATVTHHRRHFVRADTYQATYHPRRSLRAAIDRFIWVNGF